MSGLSDPTLKEKVLTQAMLGTVKDLTTLMNYATAEESSKKKHPAKEVVYMKTQNKR